MNVTKLQNLYFSKAFHDAETKLRSRVIAIRYRNNPIYSGIAYDGQNWINTVTNEIADDITWCPGNPNSKHVFNILSFIKFYKMKIRWLTKVLNLD